MSGSRPRSGSAAGAAPGGETEKIGTFASLRIPNFRVLLFGTTLSNAAQWIQQVTLNWLVYDMTGSGTALGSMNLVRSASGLGLAPAAGLAVDRFGRAFLMILTKIWLLVITVVLGLLILMGKAEVWHLFAFAFLGGAAMTIDMTLRQTVTFDLVPRSLAPNAVALIQTGWSLMRSIGPSFGGFLILWVGPHGNFFVQASAYALIAVSIPLIRFPPRKAGPDKRRGMLQNVMEGARYVARQRTTRTFTMMGWVLPLLIIPTFSALPAIYAKDIFHGGPETLGFLMSAVGLGGIVGGVFTASLGRFERRGMVQLASLAGMSISLIVFALSPNLWLALPMLGVAGAFEMVYLTTNQTLLQLSIPDAMRGRVTALVSLNAAISPIGSFFAGAGSDIIGPRLVTVAMSAAAGAVAIAVVLFSPTVRDYRLSQEMARHAPDAAPAGAGHEPSPLPKSVPAADRAP